MEIRGQLETYEVMWADYNANAVVVRIRGRRTFCGIPYWKTLRTYRLNPNAETMSVMLPGPMRHMFSDLVKKYEEYEIAWREEEG